MKSLQNQVIVLCTSREYQTAPVVLPATFSSTTIVNLTFLLTEPRADWHAVPA